MTHGDIPILLVAAWPRSGLVRVNRARMMCQFVFFRPPMSPSRCGRIPQRHADASKTTVSPACCRAGTLPIITSPSSPAILSPDHVPAAIIAAYGWRGASPAKTSSFHETITRDRVIGSCGSWPPVMDTTKAPGEIHAVSSTGARELVATQTTVVF